MIVQVFATNAMKVQRLATALYGNYTIIYYNII